MTDQLPSKAIKIERLPSQGKSYPDDFAMTYRSYSFGEIKHASTSDLTEAQILNTVLKGVESKFNKNNLTINDTMYIGILRKMASLGTSKAQVPYEVNGEVKHHVFGLEDIEFKDMVAPKLPVRVTLSDHTEYEFMPLTVQGYLKLVKMKKTKDTCAVLAMMCSNVNFDSAYKFFNDTQEAEDGEILEEISEVLDHGIEPLMIKYEEEVQGEMINRTAHIRLERRQALLSPFRDDKKPLRDRICFGPASKHQPESSGLSGSDMAEEQTS